MLTTDPLRSDPITRLKELGYEVTTIENGYVVTHLTDPMMMVAVRTRDQLTTLAHIYDERRPRPVAA